MNTNIPPSPRNMQIENSTSFLASRSTHTMKDDIAFMEDQKKKDSSQVTLREQKKKELIRNYSWWARITGKASAEAEKIIEEEESAQRELITRAKEEEEM